MTVPAFIELGSGRTAVVMLHGVGGGKGAFAPQMQPLADAGYRAVAWDMPGYGDSPAIAPYDMAGLADAALRLIAALGAERTVIVGHSMGAMVAQEAMVRGARHVAGLVLSATSPAFGKPDGAWQQAFLADRLGLLDAGRSMADVAARLVPAMIGPDCVSGAAAQAADLMRRVPPATYRTALHALMGFDRRAGLAAIAVPTLVIAGERDAAAPLTVMERMAARIPGAAFVVLPGAGHLANLEQPEAFNAALLAFLHRHFPI
jgi:3-oxoadipate enol-lactonase